MSPGYNTGENYPNSMDCKWYISIPSNQSYSLKFDSNYDIDTPDDGLYVCTFLGSIIDWVMLKVLLFNEYQGEVIMIEFLNYRIDGYVRYMGRRRTSVPVMDIQENKDWRWFYFQINRRWSYFILGKESLIGNQNKILIKEKIKTIIYNISEML